MPDKETLEAFMFDKKDKYGYRLVIFNLDTGIFEWQSERNK